MAGSKVHLTMRIEGMTCDGCARHVEKALQEVAGVEQVQVGSWKSGQAVAVADSTVDAEALTQAVEKAGYHAVVLERRPLDGQRRVPSSGEQFDLMVVGGGSAAFAAAIKA